MDVEPDFDGRFRVNDFFCYDDTWRLALTTLVKHSDVVMLDLRGFTPANAGCIFELNELVNSTPLARIVLIIDATTDVRFLKEALQAAWSQLRQGSPNQKLDSPGLTAFRLRSGAAEVGALLHWLCAAVDRQVARGPLGPN